MPVILPIIIFSLNGLFVQADVGHVGFPSSKECHETVDRIVTELNLNTDKPAGLVISGGCLTAPPSVTGVAPPIKKPPLKVDPMNRQREQGSI